MIEIKLNGQSLEIEAPCSIKKFLSLLSEPCTDGALNSLAGELTQPQRNALVDGSYALAVNEQFVPRADYDSYTVNVGDEIELLVPMQGG